MTSLEKFGIVIMFSAISVSLAYQNSEVVIEIMRPVLMMVGTILFAIGGKDASEN